MNLKIKGTTGLILNGNEISGNTFAVKDWIKAYLGGKWNGDRKVWVVDVEKVNNLLARGANIYVDDSPVTTMYATRKANRTAATNGWCNKCHSYCWGDCEANS